MTVRDAWAIAIAHTVYVHSDWGQNEAAAQMLDKVLQNELNSVTVSAPEQIVAEPEQLEVVENAA
jgi:hypothetical protein